MILKKNVRAIAFFTLFIFFCFTITYEYSFGQDESPLIKAQDLYRAKNFVDAIKVLEAFISKIQNNPTENKRLAEAYYLLARINYDSGEDTKTEDFLKKALEANDQIGKRETNPDFKTRLDQVKNEWLKTKAAENEIVPETISETKKVEETQPKAQEKEKPIQQLKKKKKFPWLLVILGVGVVVVLIVLLIKKKKLNLTVTVGEGVTGNPAAGSYTYNKGDNISYSYSLSSNSYNDLTVLLDGNKATTSGSFTMDSSHNLSASATKNTPYSNGVLTINGVRYELASIPAGEFQMGSNSSEANIGEQPVHTVRISKSFWLGKTEVTQGLWQAVMGSNPSGFKKGDTYPVEMVSWDDCQSFITKLNQMVGGNNFRLPTEAEWEYACRAGTTGDRYGDLDAIAWYSSNSGNTTHPVGQKQVNGWGLFDTLGNVYEWCQDWYGTYSSGYQTDPTGPASGAYRMLRGGSWLFYANFVRSAHRDIHRPGWRSDNIGFRLARTN